MKVDVFRVNHIKWWLQNSFFSISLGFFFSLSLSFYYISVGLLFLYCDQVSDIGKDCLFSGVLSTCCVFANRKYIASKNEKQNKQQTKKKHQPNEYKYEHCQIITKKYLVFFAIVLSFLWYRLSEQIYSYISIYHIEINVYVKRVLLCSLFCLKL